MIISFVIALLIGAIPTGLLVGRLYGRDIRQSGSGNIGATNAARVLGKKAGVLTLVGDILKGVLGTIVPQLLAINSPAVQAVAGLCAIIGHCYSPFLKFKGGKGVATSLGVFLMIAPKAALVAIAAFVFVFSASRFVSLASIAAATILPLAAAYIYKDQVLFLCAAVTAAIVIVRHQANIGRLLHRSEHRA